MATKTKSQYASPAETVTPARSGEPVPELTPEQVLTPPPVADVAAKGAPALQPPGTEAAGLRAADGRSETIGAFQSAAVTGLWTSDNPSNTYVYLAGVGWRRISPANVTSHHAMVQIARLARDRNASVSANIDGGVVKELYLW
ncbi:MAG: hypothetical protein KY463_08490 [Actinobacteria bacterium]|nr:hypothetical protein [Actinomycetota bacterium]